MNDNAGFSNAEPWLPVADNYREVNVAAQDEDPGSLLSWHRALLRLRKERPSLNRGSCKFIGDDPDVLAYVREEGRDRIIVALNLSGSVKELALDGFSAGAVVLSTTPGKAVSSGQRVILDPYEALLLQV